MIRVHINDPLDQEALNLLKSKSQLQVTCEHLDKDKLLELIPQIEVLIVRSATKVTEDLINKGEKLKVIGRAGVGLDNIDVTAAKQKGIKVLNTPGASSISVAELTFGLILSASRHIARGTCDLKKGLWTKKELEGHELYGKTIGIVGLGTIGKEVAKRSIAFGMKVIAYDPFVEYFEGVKMVSLEELFTNSDIITLHVPLSNETKHMINSETISKMKDGVIIINASRGGVIDEQALYDALSSGKIYAAALDVFEVEPPADDLRKKLLQLPNVTATPHIGASTHEAQAKVGRELVERIFAELGI
ncbi:MULTISPECIES: D-2-hydroxyacid dehydrogenase [Pseudothermotoga]|jgi:D-3-phosphoglycerate dehydrogenase|uniref:Phosphoglycerate dehydrogenase n=1 Tax=Pseudothermotoga lettingae (strain ATCC BAA-301 / DSM 14385 / NBRC 107922 / TMO) TaxID=416591 RepID=A8F838_PSELT|nr:MULTISPECIES: D-2-hydroxyacid dehydrogenase [Pseudothermotoga]ABV34322.1 Phosphoglycerate dehydrogenase [Pseudothermotoga lettingae TMO]MDI3494930.1 hydroxypyruvate reductase [Pseudothermotoga sp.]GLI48733.1 hydroxypyruvate reductase [Pseudothermotoga lettingae TMO]HBJ81404.1 3-phosphoglycerate dehydrogenase [Pseudothermotoga sp.]